MPQHHNPGAALMERFDRLIRELEEESGDGPPKVDEGDFFQSVDKAANDPDCDPRILQEAGRRFADHFVVPYLHASDPAVVITEIGALMEIHHRATIRLEALDRSETDVEATVCLRRIDEAQEAPTPFDAAVLERAFTQQVPGAAIETLEPTDKQAPRYCIRTKA